MIKYICDFCKNEKEQNEIIKKEIFGCTKDVCAKCNEEINFNIIEEEIKQIEEEANIKKLKKIENFMKTKKEEEIETNIIEEN